MLQSSSGTTKLKTVRASCGFSLDGVYVTDSSLSILATMASWPYVTTLLEPELGVLGKKKTYIILEAINHVKLAFRDGHVSKT